MVRYDDSLTYVSRSPTTTSHCLLSWAIFWSSFHV